MCMQTLRLIIANKGPDHCTELWFHAMIKALMTHMLIIAGGAQCAMISMWAMASSSHIGVQQ